MKFLYRKNLIMYVYAKNINNGIARRPSRQFGLTCRSKKKPFYAVSTAYADNF